MTARQVMNDRPITLNQTDRLRDAAEIILTHHFRNVPVVDERGRYLGVISSNRLLASILPKAATMDEGMADLSFVKDTVEDLRERWRETENLPVTQVMDTSLRTVAPDTSLAETLLALYQNRTSLPVVEQPSGRLVGIVSHWGVGMAVLGRNGGQA
jgi:CBS domain-containing membrane protein